MSVRINILLVEDDPANQELFKEFCEIFAAKNPDVDLNHEICDTEEKAYHLLQEESFNAAIIDLNLKKDEDAGIRILEKIHDDYRIPMIVFSGNADRTEDKKYVLKSISKGSTTYGELIEELYKFNRTGIMNILGKTGQLEKLLDKVFWENLYPKMPKLQQYASEYDIEQDLLRYIVSHFSEALEEGVRYFMPEEMLIYPPINDEIKTGSIVKNKTSNEYFIVMSPACDIQQGCDRFVLASIFEIDSLEDMQKKYEAIDEAEKKLKQYFYDTPEPEIKKKEIAPLEGAVKNAKKNVLDKIKSFIHSPSNRFHYISSNDYFGDSIIDFHELISIPRDTISSFKKEMSVTPPFLKDVQSRFSSYYARQGSPDFDATKILNKYEKMLFEE